MCGSGSPQSKRWRKRNSAEEAMRALGVDNEDRDGETAMAQTMTVETTRGARATGREDEDE